MVAKQHRYKKFPCMISTYELVVLMRKSDQTYPDNMERFFDSGGGHPASGFICCGAAATVSRDRDSQGESGWHADSPVRGVACSGHGGLKD